MNTRLKVALAVAATTAYATGATSGVSLSINDAPRLQENRKGG